MIAGKLIGAAVQPKSSAWLTRHVYDNGIDVVHTGSPPINVMCSKNELGL
jgi:hypothetical protein